jgi:site-specific recombinase XerC
MTVASSLTLAEAARIVREATKNKQYREYPLGQEAGHYLRFKRKRLTAASYRDYEGCLDKLARDHTDLRIEDFEPPIGTQRVEEFLDDRWGTLAPRTYNKNLSILRDFFKWQVLRGNLHGDPTLPIERAKKRAVYRTTFTATSVARSSRRTPSFATRSPSGCCSTYGLRKGALQRVQFKHFDHVRRRLTIFTKGEKIQSVPIPSPAFWNNLDRLALETEARPDHYLLPKQKAIPRHIDPETGLRISELYVWPDKQRGQHGIHDWWYRCLARAGVVEEGATRGERMHKARHTAGQRVLDKTGGNIKAAQKLLGHEQMETTANEYLDWDIDQLAETLAGIDDDEG